MDEATVRDRLRTVNDPLLEDDIVSLGLVNSISITDDTISISLGLGAPYSPVESTIANTVRETLSDTDFTIELSAHVNRTASGNDVLPTVKNIIAVASGKGGVGKSTIAVNLAAGLADYGARVGLFDADVYGPNIPRMVAANDQPNATADDTIIPPEQFGVKLMSMDFLIGRDDPVIWRGPMVHKVITQLIEDVEWGALDYLIIDLPPGTGDTQLTVLQTIPLTGAVIVTTPQAVAVDDARKGLRMFGRHETTVLGIVENMSSFVCPECGNSHDIFGQGGGETFANEVSMPFLGSIPLDPAIREGGDIGTPIVLDEDSDTGDAFRSFIAKTADNIGVVARRHHSETFSSAEVEV